MKDKITVNDIDLNFVYDRVSFIESHMMHEYKRMGVSGLKEKYIANIEEFRKDWSHDDFCFLLGILEYLVPDFRYDKECTREKYVLDPDSIMDYIFGDLTEEGINKSYENALEAPKRHGFLWYCYGEAV